MDLTRNLRVDSVQRLNPTPPKVIDIGETVAEAVEIMRREKVGCLLVTKMGELAGIFTERDLLKRVLAVAKPLTDPLADVITEQPVSVLNSDPIRLAIHKMQKGGYRHLPVVDDANRPAGVISVKRIVHYLAEHYPQTIHNQPPDPQQVPSQPEGA